MPNTNRSQPQNWFMPLRPSPSATLASDEQLAMVLHYEVLNTAEKTKTHTLFTVVRKGDKAVARSIMSHGNDTGYCAGHAEDIAEYPIADVAKLVEETRSHGLMMAVMLMQEPSSFHLKLDVNKPAYYLQTPNGATNAEIITKMMEDNDPVGDIAKQVIISVLGLNQVSSSAPAAVVVSPIQNESLSPEKALEKAAIESDLIKRFGKKKMTDLAKKMNYNGQIINKGNTKTHVNNN